MKTLIERIGSVAIVCGLIGYGIHDCNIHVRPSEPAGSCFVFHRMTLKHYHKEDGTVWNDYVDNNRTELYKIIKNRSEGRSDEVLVGITNSPAEAIELAKQMNCPLK